jgi:hypothetical protein
MQAAVSSEHAPSGFGVGPFPKSLLFEEKSETKAKLSESL